MGENTVKSHAVAYADPSLSTLLDDKIPEMADLLALHCLLTFKCVQKKPFCISANETSWTESFRLRPVTPNGGTKRARCLQLTTPSCTPFVIYFGSLMGKAKFLCHACTSQEPNITPLLSSFHVEQQAVEALPKPPWTIPSWAWTSRNSFQRTTLHGDSESWKLPEEPAITGLMSLPAGCHEHVEKAGRDFSTPKSMKSVESFFKALKRAGEMSQERRPLAAFTALSSASSFSSHVCIY